MSLKAQIKQRVPNVFWIRSALAKIKIKKYYRYVMPEQEIQQAEQSREKKKAITEKYTSLWPEYAKAVEEKIDEILSKAPAYQEREDHEWLRIDMRFCRFAYGFQPDEYLCFGLEGKRAEEKRSFISDIDRYRYAVQMNDLVDFVTFVDKGKTYERFSEFYQREAISISGEEDFEIFSAFVAQHPVFVKKNVSMSCGDSVALVDMAKENGSERLVFEALISAGKHILEEQIIQSEKMASLNTSSVNTVRCMTFNTEQGIVIPFCFLKAGQGGSFVDNAGKGGIVVGLDTSTGEGLTDGFDEYGCRYSSHPETGIVFKGFQVPDWQQLRELCTRMAQMEPNVKYIGWDLAYTDHGWVVVEGNSQGQFIIPQIVFQRGIKADVLRIMETMRLWA